MAYGSEDVANPPIVVNDCPQFSLTVYFPLLWRFQHVATWRRWISLRSIKSWSVSSVGQWVLLFYLTRRCGLDTAHHAISCDGARFPRAYGQRRSMRLMHFTLLKNTAVRKTKRFLCHCQRRQAWSPGRRPSLKTFFLSWLTYAKHHKILMTKQLSNVWWFQWSTKSFFV